MSELNGITTTEIWDAKMLLKLLLADGVIKEVLDKKFEDKQYTTIRSQLQNILTKLLNKKHKNLTFSREQLIEFYNTPDMFKNELKVKYNFSSKRNMGRVYPEASLGYATVKNVIRHTLCQGKYIDIDMENAHFNLLNEHSKRSLSILTIIAKIAKVVWQ